MPFFSVPSNTCWELLRTFGVALRDAIIGALDVNTVLWSVEVESVSVGILIALSKTQAKNWLRLRNAMAAIFSILLVVKILILLSPYFTHIPVE